MSSRAAMLEQWIAKTLQSYPSPAIPFISGEKDPFRNPVGHTVRQSLATLLEQLQGDMDPACIAPALNAIIRLRAVQDLTASQAVGFVFLLKPIVREFGPEHDTLRIEERIDRLALMAFDKYMQCREQLANIRLSESRRKVAHQGAG